MNLVISASEWCPVSDVRGQGELCPLWTDRPLAWFASGKNCLR
jgi:hypothetical protein